MTTTSPAPAPVDQKVERLTNAAARRVIEPDTDVAGSIGEGQLLPDELLSIAGLGLDLTDEEKAALSREEVASITAAGIRFEAVLEAGFAIHFATAEDLTDPRFTFILHEMGEETRHQRLFQRLLSQLAPVTRSPIPMRLVRLGYRIVTDVAASNPGLFYVLVLAGEEIPDRFQKLASEHPDTDPFIKDVNKYHRMEEARHLSFARAVFPEVIAKATRLDKFLVRQVAPRLITFMFNDIVHPGVYAVVGLPTWETWRKAIATPERAQLRYDSTRPVLAVVLDGGAVKKGAIPAAWQRLCGVDAEGDPVDAITSDGDIESTAVEVRP